MAGKLERQTYILMFQWTAGGTCWKTRASEEQYTELL